MLGFRLFAPEGTPVEVVSRAGSWLNWSDRHGAYVGSLIGEGRDNMLEASWIASKMLDDLRRRVAPAIVDETDRVSPEEFAERVLASARRAA